MTTFIVSQEDMRDTLFCLCDYNQVLTIVNIMRLFLHYC